MKFIDINKGEMVHLSLEEYCEQNGIEMPEPEKENTMSFTPKGLLDAITEAATEETKRQEEETGIKYPAIVVQLAGVDGNAFNVMAVVTKALKGCGICKAERDEFLAEAMSGDYDHLLQTCMKWVTVE